MPGKRDGKKEMVISPFKMFLYLCFCGFIFLIIVGYTTLTSDSYVDGDSSMPKFQDKHETDNSALQEPISEPIILWWTGFTGEPGRYRKCGHKSCFFTADRHYWQHHQTKALLFYGSDIKVKDLPLPRKPQHQWGIMHEESPKNNYVLVQPEFIELFNHTSTFRRESDFPLTLQSLETIEWLESKKYLVPTAEKNKLLSELSPLFYTQSDCDVPSDRDNYVTMLMKEIGVDSYGSCVHNKDLPEHLVDPIKGMEHTDFYSLQAKYKFSLAMENAICDDYITEKLWRPLMLGSVPIIHGSPKIRDLLPDKHSAIIIEDFKSIKKLVKHLRYLNDHDEQYEKYLHWKKTGVTNVYLRQQMSIRPWSIVETWRDGHSNFVEGFECFVCDRLHENIKRVMKGEKELKYQADKSHLQCPGPVEFDSQGQIQNGSSGWSYDYRSKTFEAKTVKYFVDKNYPMSVGDFHAKNSELIHNSKSGWL